MSFNSRIVRKNYRLLYKLLESEYSKDQADKVFELAEKYIENFKKTLPEIPEGQVYHTEMNIFPRLSTYKAMEELFGKNRAQDLTNQHVDILGSKIGKFMNFFSSLPLIGRFYLKIYALVAKKAFGPASGFKQTFHQATMDTLSFDMLECPYVKYCKALNCPEALHFFCDSDFYNYGHLDNYSFNRTETLEKGQRCDFRLKRK